MVAFQKTAAVLAFANIFQLPAIATKMVAVQKTAAVLAFANIFQPRAIATKMVAVQDSRSPQPPQL